ncbi:thymidylate kinase [Oceanotoga sp. DSM 15011]|uniref:dTMP kinase n=1 Tax=Oceanotoga teriensis TaxID=515440 RepID=A0AA45C763_9BACT|nr:MULTISPECIES: thymidylate kinase [Oceanotoga]MDO7976687.1 thymidylate kinase [Oceanotoga teriensis]PWJ95208.1 dTMP kinase [Oceanotoga teriensis]UYP00665.1 thymidylate kinase [Oceanotoga sp. DSM 15011]
MKGKLIVIESGSDSSGKATQTKLLFDKLKDFDFNCMKVEYPNYDSNSSALVKMYLNGEFGENPNDVDPYTSSTFFAVDRYASFKKEWESFYVNRGLVLADRYTTSNMVHQGSKYDNLDEKNLFLNWLWDLEFNKMKLPIPDLVIFLDVPIEFSFKLLEERKAKSKVEDIHEKNLDYLKITYDNSKYIAKKYNWHIINCVENNNLRSQEDISNEIFNYVIKYIK